MTHHENSQAQPISAVLEASIKNGNQPTSPSESHYAKRIYNYVAGWDWGFLVDPDRDIDGKLTSMFDAVRRWSFECLYSRVGEPAIQGGRPRRIQMGVKPYCLTLLGPSGTGKTHLCKQAMACVNSIKTRAGDTYKTIHWPTLFADMKEEEDFGKYHYYCKNYGHLFIDELCKVSAGNFDITQVGTGMESRLKKWTLITANLSMEEIAVDLDPRIASRMSGRGNLYLQLSEDTPDFG